MVEDKVGLIIGTINWIYYNFNQYPIESTFSTILLTFIGSLIIIHYKKVRKNQKKRKYIKKNIYGCVDVALDILTEKKLTKFKPKQVKDSIYLSKGSKGNIIKQGKLMLALKVTEEEIEEDIIEPSKYLEWYYLIIDFCLSEEVQSNLKSLKNIHEKNIKLEITRNVYNSSHSEKYMGEKKVPTIRIDSEVLEKIDIVEDPKTQEWVDKLGFQKLAELLKKPDLSKKIERQLSETQSSNHISVELKKASTESSSDLWYRNTEISDDTRETLKISKSLFLEMKQSELIQIIHDHTHKIVLTYISILLYPGCYEKQLAKRLSDVSNPYISMLAILLDENGLIYKITGKRNKEYLFPILSEEELLETSAFDNKQICLFGELVQEDDKYFLKEYPNILITGDITVPIESSKKYWIGKLIPSGNIKIFEGRDSYSI